MVDFVFINFGGRRNKRVSFLPQKNSTFSTFKKFRAKSHFMDFIQSKTNVLIQIRLHPIHPRSNPKSWPKLTFPYPKFYFKSHVCVLVFPIKSIIAIEYLAY